MTRFARAKGSKSSNERVPESATSWNEMKQELKNTQEQKKTKKAREEMNKKRQENYDEFVAEEDAKVGKKWAKFDDIDDDESDLDDEMKQKIEQSLEDDEGPVEKSSKPTEKSPKLKKRKLEKPKKLVEQVPKRRKPELVEALKITVNGKEQEIKRFDGFPVLRTDFDRLQELRKSLIQKAVPQSEIKRTIMSERRKSEKYLSRLKKHVCFNCRKSGHVLSECPDLSNQNSSLVDQSGTGICFKCGSTEHKLNECKSRGDGLKFASCFICREQGHIARECPDNPRGLYPKGGACKGCGDVTHLKKDCPLNQEKEEKKISVGTLDDEDLEGLGQEKVTKIVGKKSGKKVVKF